MGGSPLRQVIRSVPWSRTRPLPQSGSPGVPCSPTAASYRHGGGPALGQRRWVRSARVRRTAARPAPRGALSHTYAAAPAGMGGQKLTSRQPSTPSVATLLVSPEADQQHRGDRIERRRGQAGLDRDGAQVVGDAVRGEQFHRVGEAAERGDEAPQRRRVQQPVERGPGQRARPGRAGRWRAGAASRWPAARSSPAARRRPGGFCPPTVRRMRAARAPPRVNPITSAAHPASRAGADDGHRPVQAAGPRPAGWR